MTQKQYSLADVIELQKQEGFTEEEVKEKLRAASFQPTPELKISEAEYRQVFGDKDSKNGRKRTKKDTSTPSYVKTGSNEKTHSIDSARKQVQEATKEELNWQQFIQILTATGLDNQDTFSEVEIHLLTTTCQSMLEGVGIKNVAADSVLVFENKLLEIVTGVATKRAEDYAAAIEKLIEQTTIKVMSKQRDEVQLNYFQTTDEALAIVEGKSPLNLGSKDYSMRKLPKPLSIPSEELEAKTATASQPSKP